jgi:hypothetical protein
VAAAGRWDWFPECPSGDCDDNLPTCSDCGPRTSYACANWVGDTSWLAQGTWNIPQVPPNPPTTYVNSASVSCSVLGPDRIDLKVNPAVTGWSDLLGPGPPCVLYFTPWITQLGTGLGSCAPLGIAERIWRSSTWTGPGYQYANQWTPWAHSQQGLLYWDAQNGWLYDQKSRPSSLRYDDNNNLKPDGTCVDVCLQQVAFSFLGCCPGTQVDVIKTYIVSTWVAGNGFDFQIGAAEFTGTVPPG